MKLFLALALCLSAVNVFAESYQLDSWSCASGDAPEREFNHATAKTLLNLRPVGTYDVVSIDGGFWSLERGYFRQNPNQLCLEAREGAQYERAYWSGRIFRGCAETVTTREGDLHIRILNHNGLICRSNDVVVLHYGLLEEDSRENSQRFTGLPF